VPASIPSCHDTNPAVVASVLLLAFRSKSSGSVQMDFPLRFSASIFVTLATLSSLTACNDREARREEEMVELGRMLFEDTHLGADGRTGCISCHLPDYAFTDQRATSRGTGGALGTRNSPSLLDVSTVSSFFWDGRESSLEDAVLQPFTNPVEMGLASDSVLLEKIAIREEYIDHIEGIFGTRQLQTDHISKPLVSYLRSLPIAPTRYDLSLIPSSGFALSATESAGLALFTGKAGCVECHRLSGSPATLADGQFHHTGIGFERVAGNIKLMLDRLEALERDDQPIGNAILVDSQIAELGRFASTRRPSDLGAFRTPSLRNVSRTAPYMHDGSVTTLRSAVERELYYRSLARGRPITLTRTEQDELLEFLSALDTADSLD
jgi:cytochrome c peroxidase